MVEVGEASPRSSTGPPGGLSGASWFSWGESVSCSVVGVSSLLDSSPDVGKNRWYINLGSKEIRQWPINCCISLMMIYKFCKLHLVVEHWNTQLNKPTNQNSMQVPIDVKPTNKKTDIIKLWGTSAINSPMSSPSPHMNAHEKKRKGVKNFVLGAKRIHFFPNRLIY